jgi:hypothetical protein
MNKAERNLRLGEIERGRRGDCPCGQDKRKKTNKK